MEAKEKAEQLINKFMGVEPLTHHHDGIGGHLAKQCAMIHADGLIEEHKEVHNATCGELFTQKMSAKLVLYWQEVKNEIKIL